MWRKCENMNESINVNLYDYFAKRFGIESSVPKINLATFKQNCPEVYNALTENAFEYKRQYELFKGIVKLADENLFYRMYIEESTLSAEYVYFIKNKTTDLIKIGMTKRPKQRIMDLSSMLKTSTGIKHDLEYIGVIYTTSTNMQDLETSLHQKYDGHRKYGEWFDLSEYEIINTYFSDSYNVNGIRMIIEHDNRCILSNMEQIIPNDFWTYMEIHKMMDKCNKNHAKLEINDIYFNMFSYFNINEVIGMIEKGIEKYYENKILQKANRDM